MREYIRRMRETLHQNPEVAFAEHKTAELVASELRRMGFAVKTGIGKTGVVGILRFAEDGPCVAVRADMDALPIEEATGVDFSSQNSGVMHACGHDTHTAIALGICAYLATRISSAVPLWLFFNQLRRLWPGQKRCWKMVCFLK